MTVDFKEIIGEGAIEFSAPCRVDMGGTLDINTLNYPLNHLVPSTFNIALDMRTTVRLTAYKTGKVKVTSKGFEGAEFPAGLAPFDHPMGLIFAVAAYFAADGVAIHIESGSPPRSALGGSSVAATALVAAFIKLMEPSSSVDDGFRHRAAMIAHYIEAGVAGVPCGFQDQLAAAFGGVNSWVWNADPTAALYVRRPVLPEEKDAELEASMLVAYCGEPHESKDINGIWVREFLSGSTRPLWKEIITCTREFTRAMGRGDFSGAARQMAKETEIRREMTPQVLDRVGDLLVDSARLKGCGARFTGAGGGGCLWALGDSKKISALKNEWENILKCRKDACLLSAGVDRKGLSEHVSHVREA